MKPTQIRIRVTYEERQRWKFAAEKQKKTLSDWVRELLEAGAAKAAK